ncbi:hypothetical protein HLK66_00920 [Niallia circulans]|uniref:hypothetical protein n=1 Tax=Niallia circulans TaxID=1397 RepID=UPI0014907919|nr:hypothetical protein [Niallia circulans]QJX60373.1 hypothetical protein HLK66_00920 [Niallia circulans]
MPSYSINLESLLTTNTEPREKYKYVNGERTETVEGYSYRLIDVSNGEILNITIPRKKILEPQTYVEIVNAVGTPFVTNNRATLSIKAEDIHPTEL